MIMTDTQETAMTTDTPITLDGNPITNALDCARAIGDPTQTYLYLQLDYETGRIELKTRSSSDNSSTAAEWHGRASSWRLDRCPNALHLVAMFDAESDALALVERIVAGYSEDSDTHHGSSPVGSLTEDAEESRDELVRAIEDASYCGGNLSGEGVALYSAGEWFEAEPPTVPACMDPCDFEEFKAEIRSIAEYEGAVVYGLDEYLEELRDEAADSTTA